jgi:ribosomal protein L17
MAKTSPVAQMFHKIKKELADEHYKQIQERLKKTTLAELLFPPLSPKEMKEKLDKDREARKRGNQIMQKKKRDIHNTFNELLRQGGYTRPIKYKNPIANIIASVKKEYKNKTGQDLKLSNGTLENWVYDYFNCHGN